VARATQVGDAQAVAGQQVLFGRGQAARGEAGVLIVGWGVASLLYLAGAKRFAGGKQALPATADPVGSAS